MLTYIDSFANIQHVILFAFFVEGFAMKFDFDWNYVSAGAPYVTVSELGLAFNTLSINLLGIPEEVVVGFDETNLTIGVKDARDMKNVKSYRFRDRIRNGWIRIGCKEFVKNLSSISGISFSPAIKYIARYDRDERLLYFTINEKEVEQEQ